MSLRSEIDAIQRRKEELIEALVTEMSKLEDSRHITRISDNIFTIKSSDLKENWSAMFHDNKAQMKTIIETIYSKNDLQIIQNMLQFIVDKGTLITKGHTIHFNQQVRDYIKNLL